MGLLKTDTFICLDCETTGLDPKVDRIIEIAYVKFTLDTTLESFETLVDPNTPIPEVSMAIHHISQDMVRGKPTIDQILPVLLEKIRGHIIVGHGIKLDIEFIAEESIRNNIQSLVRQERTIDTLRLARLYGQSPTNSLERLRQHFNIEDEGAHRAMNDVVVNIEVFKYLAQNFKTTEEILKRLEKPILLKMMPLGKHKGRPFSEVPTEYLRWALTKDFDMDLTFSLKAELKKRKSGKSFHQFANPFSDL
jgi:DNA polymerase III subunit epsilon